MAVIGVLLQDDSRLCHVLLLLKIVGCWVVAHRHEIRCILYLLLLIGCLSGGNLERVKRNILLRLLLHLMNSAKGVSRLMVLLLLLIDHQFLLLHERCKLHLLLGKQVAGRLQEEELLLGFAIW